MEKRWKNNIWIKLEQKLTWKFIEGEHKLSILHYFSGIFGKYRKICGIGAVESCRKNRLGSLWKKQFSIFHVFLLSVWTFCVRVRGKYLIFACVGAWDFLFCCFTRFCVNIFIIFAKRESSISLDGIRKFLIGKTLNFLFKTMQICNGIMKI